MPCLFTSGLGVEERWIVVNSVSADEMGDPMRRMRETVLLTSYRAQRAEKIIQEMRRKLKSEANARLVAKPTEKPKEKEVVVKEEKPFWQKSADELHMTYEELSRGRFYVVQVAVYHGTNVAAYCLSARVTSEESKKVLTECLETAAHLRHPNLVTFIGAVLERQPIVITELIPLNLRMVLEKDSLNYYQYIDVASDVAKALEFLHSNKPDPVIHGELASACVLLEEKRGLKWRAKLFDYVTAKYFNHLVTSLDTPTANLDDIFIPMREHPSQEYKVLRRSHSRSHSGSPFDSFKKHASPDRIVTPSRKISKPGGGMSVSDPLDMGAFSTQRDVYLYGILLVEMATRTAVLEVSLQYLIESITWHQVSSLIKECLTPNPELRPDIESVLSKVVQLISYKP